MTAITSGALTSQMSKNPSLSGIYTFIICMLALLIYIFLGGLH
jgi:hypothetical protein